MEQPTTEHNKSYLETKAGLRVAAMMYLLLQDKTIQQDELSEAYNQLTELSDDELTIIANKAEEALGKISAEQRTALTLRIGAIGQENPLSKQMTP